MKKIVDYCVFAEKDVKDKLEEGWVLLGGACCMPTETSRFADEFFQAMVKYEEETAEMVNIGIAIKALNKTQKCPYCGENNDGSERHYSVSEYED